MLRINLSLAAIFITTAAIFQHTPAAAQSKAPAAEAVIGHYRFESGIIYSVEKSGKGLTLKQSKQSGLRDLALSAKPDGKFSFANGEAYLMFDLDPSGIAETLHVHAINKTLPATRVDAVVAKQANDDFDAKIKNQTRDPACEQTLRRVIEEIRAGKPDYSKMPLANVAMMHQQLPALEEKIKKMGAVKEVKFVGIGDKTGRDRFIVTFEDGRSDWRIMCLANGWIGVIDIR